MWLCSRRSDDDAGCVSQQSLLYPPTHLHVYNILHANESFHFIKSIHDAAIHHHYTKQHHQQQQQHETETKNQKEEEEEEKAAYVSLLLCCASLVAIVYLCRRHISTAAAASFRLFSLSAAAAAPLLISTRLYHAYTHQQQQLAISTPFDCRLLSIHPSVRRVIPPHGL